MPIVLPSLPASTYKYTHRTKTTISLFVRAPQIPKDGNKNYKELPPPLKQTPSQKIVFCSLFFCSYYSCGSYTSRIVPRHSVTTPLLSPLPPHHLIGGKICQKQKKTRNKPNRQNQRKMYATTKKFGSDPNQNNVPPNRVSHSAPPPVTVYHNTIQNT